MMLKRSHPSAKTNKKRVISLFIYLFLFLFIGQLFDATCTVWRSTGEAVEVAKKDFIEVLKVLEEALGEKTFFGGETFGFVDIVAIPMASWFYASEKFGNFTVEAECPKLSAWIKRSMQRESVAKVLPDPEKVYDFVVMFRKMQGIE
jgi:glutathione S-transferase